MVDGSNPLLSSSARAWEELVEAMEPASLLLVIDRLMNLASKRVATAEDILQEALLHAWRDRHAFEWRGLRSFRSWLLSIIDHRIHDAADRSSAQKRGGGRPMVPLDDGDARGHGTTSAGTPDIPGGSTTPSRLAAYREQAEIMRKALDRLPEESREIVRLRLLELRTLEEIAAELGIGVPAVRHRFRKGSEVYLRELRLALGSNAGSIAAESTPPTPPESSPRSKAPRDP